MLRPSPNHGTQRLPNDDDLYINYFHLLADAHNDHALFHTCCWPLELFLNPSHQNGGKTKLIYFVDTFRYRFS